MNDQAAPVLVILGTRPEVIKLAPVIAALRRRSREIVLCSTSQQRDLTRQALDLFSLRADVDLDVMTPGQSPETVLARCLERLPPILGSRRWATVVIQGDTTSALAGALAGFYQRIPVAHVEAGLRTYDRAAPFPEETQRQLISSLADLHFAPTEAAARHLRNEGRDPQTIHVTGNTVVDALGDARLRLRVPARPEVIPVGKRGLLVTMHRRESFGAPMQATLSALKEFLAGHPAFHALVILHPNPHASTTTRRLLGDSPSVTLSDPLPYPELLYQLSRCECVLTDSGGLQEEAPSFGKPVLVLRTKTERLEAVERGWSQLVGHDRSLLLARLAELAARPAGSWRPSDPRNPFGDGKAAERIVDVLEHVLGTAARRAA